MSEEISVDEKYQKIQKIRDEKKVLENREKELESKLVLMQEKKED